MVLVGIRASRLAIPFRVSFKHASAERAATESLLVEALTADGTRGHGEGCPRAYVTAEDLASAEAFVARYRDDWLAAIRDLATLADWAERHRADIDRAPAAWTAVELALLDTLGRAEGRSLESLLGLPELTGLYRYTAVLGDAAPVEFERQLAGYRQSGFGAFKIKLSGDPARDRAKVEALAAAGIAPDKVRADANNLWRDAGAAIAHLGALGYPFVALEEPLVAGDHEGLARIGAALGVPIILDESLVRADQLARYAAPQGRFIVNLRVSKMGGLLRSLALLREARRLGLPVIVGAHVGETSLLTRAALTVAHAARDVLIAREGAFGTHLLAHDLSDPPLMFGAGGMLDVAASGISGKPGSGLAVSPPQAIATG
jgi:L-alanine-DL-glutamate epimerase-like enolase superfamily enzyme